MYMEAHDAHRQHFSVLLD